MGAREPSCPRQPHPPLRLGAFARAILRVFARVPSPSHLPPRPGLARLRQMRGPDALTARQVGNGPRQLHTKHTSNWYNFWGTPHDTTSETFYMREYASLTTRSGATILTVRPLSGPAFFRDRIRPTARCAGKHTRATSSVVRFACHAAVRTGLCQRGAGDKTMIATLLILLAVLDGSPAYTPPRPGAYRAAPLCAVRAPVAPATTASPAIAASQPVTHHVFLPIVARQPSGCEPIPGQVYDTLDVEGPPTGRPSSTPTST